MNNKINKYYLITNVLILFFGLIGIIFIYYIKNTKEIEYINENISNLNISYNSSLETYSVLTKYVLEETIQNEEILSLFEKGVNSNGDERRMYKGLLYRQLEPIYENLKKEGIRQLHFHLKNNESYIRFHQPNKYGDDLSLVRESINIANKENTKVTSFETGRVISGFRNVFPLNFNGVHLGSIELGISTKTMIESLLKQDKGCEYLFILNKDIVLPKLFDSQKDLYKVSSINSNYLIEDRDSSLPDSPAKLSSIAININEKINNNMKLKEAMAKGDKYGMFVKSDDNIYDVTFIPMLGVTKKIEGYLVEYKRSKNIPIIIKMDIYAYLLVIFSTVLLLVLIRIIKQKTKSLDKQKQWFNSITDGLGEGLYVMNLNSEITYINPIACEMLGYKKDDIIGKNAHLLFHSHSFNNNLEQKYCPIFLEVIKGGIFTSQKEHFYTSDGRNIPVSLISRMINSNSGEVEIVTSFSNIIIQKELEDKSTLLIKALESSINCIVITDKDAHVQWANKAFENLTGFKIVDIMGKNPKEFISSHKQTEEFYSEMWKTILDKKPWKGELINKKKDGTFYDEELIITPVLNENDEIVNFIAVKQDITHRKLLLLEKEAKDKLFYQQSKMAAMREMLGNIAHQWRQPLSVISTAATGLKIQKEMDILSDENFYSTLVSINTSAQYLSSTIDDFRGFFNPSNNKIREFNIVNIFTKTLNLLNAQFVAKDIEIIQNIEDCKIFSIENELIQVLINILNNARDVLIQKENQRKLIFINEYTKDNISYIEIKDNAGGIKEEIIDRIFEPYFTTKHQSQGTGIGLFMSKEIIEKHLDGELLVSNEKYNYENIEYVGAKFTILIHDLEVKG